MNNWLQDKEEVAEVVSVQAKEIEDVKEELSSEGSAYDIEQEKHYYKTGYQACLSKEDWKAAISNLRNTIVSIGSGSYIHQEALYYLALTYYVSNDYDNGLHYFEQYLVEFADTNYTDESLYYLGCAHYSKGDIRKCQNNAGKINHL